MNLINEKQIIQQASKGDIRAFENIVNSYKERVMHVCFSYCNNTEDAEDIAQDVFVELYNSLNKFTFKSSLATWIYRIASNKSIDFLRAQKRVKRGSGLISSINEDNYTLQAISNNESASDAIVQEQRKEFLYAGLNKLADRQREAFVLTQIEGMSQKEVAEIMQTTVKSIEVLVVRGRKKLKSVLEKQLKSFL